MVGPNFIAAARNRRQLLRVGPSMLVLGAAASTVAVSDALAFEMVSEGTRFVLVEGATFEIDPETNAAELTMDGRTVRAPESHYEIFADDVYVTREFAAVELARHIPTNAPTGILITDAALAVPLLGASAAAALYFLQSVPLRFENPAVGTAAENETSVTYTPTVNRDLGEAVRYSITGNGADDGLFTIDPSSGRLSFQDAPSFEQPEDQNSDNIYSVEVQASDGQEAVKQTVSVSLLDKNEAPSWVSGDTATATENSTATSYQAFVSDPDVDAVHTFSLSGNGPDDDLFEIDSTTGVLRFRAPADFEVPADADGDNRFDVQLVASDGVNTVVRNVTLSLLNANEAPVLTSGTSGFMDENGTVTSYRATADDVDAGDSQLFSIVVQGADDNFFTIDPSTGVVGLVGALDFEIPSDQNGDGDYEFSVEVEDAGGLTDRIEVSITLQDVNEAPVFENAGPFSVQENATAGTIVDNVDANEGDGGTTDTDVRYAITGGSALGLFTINADTGEISVAASDTLDFEATASYQAEVTATDQTNTALTALRTFTINLTDENEAPEFTSVNTLTIAEGATSPTLQAAVSDPEGDSITWSIVGGADSALFSISGTGELSLDAPENYESPNDANGDNQHEVTIRAQDSAGNQSDLTVQVSITDVDEVPTFNSGGSSSQSENTTTTGYVAAATDPESGSLTYSIIGTGADDAFFTIDPVTGTLSFINPPDAEALSDANGDNDYEVNLRVSDGVNTADQAVTISVGNVNEAPQYTGVTVDNTLEETTSTSYLASGTDPEGDSLSYSLAGTGDDDALFIIDGTTGLLSFITEPDFETPGSFNGDNVFALDVVVSDGVLSDTESVFITVVNVNEDPTLAPSSTTNMDEGLQDTGFVASATDVDAGDDQTFSLAAASATNDNALLQIAPDTGVLSFLTAPDFEDPQSYLGTNTYTVDVVVDDDFGGQDTQTYFIAVQDDPDI